MRGRTIAIDECASAIADTFTVVFDQIEQWRSRVERLVAEGKGSLASGPLDELVESLVIPELERDGALVIGAGVVAAPGFLTDTDWHLAWWLGHANTFGVGNADPTVRRLVATEDPSSENFRDYTTLEWWRVPTTTRARHITGPYVDYLCTDDYTLTLTVPVDYAGAIIGVAGADLYVNDIELTLLPLIRALDATATIVNASGRVVVSTDAHRPTGAVMRVEGLRERLAAASGAAVELADGRRAIACGGTSLALVVG